MAHLLILLDTIQKETDIAERDRQILGHSLKSGPMTRNPRLWDLIPETLGYETLTPGGFVSVLN